MRASDFEISNYNKLDKILSKLCEMVVKGQQSEKDYGMVAAAVLDPDNQIVARLNRPGDDGKRIHAEHAAMEDYEDKYGPIPEGSIVITTLSPCNEHMDERDGPSCTSIINDSTVRKVYCGYMDPTQDDDTRQFNLMETADKSIRIKCKQFADTFLGDVHETQTLEERRKKKRQVRHAAYGPGLFGGYGYYSGYGGDSSGDGGGGESVAEGLNESLSSLVAQDQSERNEYKNFVKSQAGGDWTKGAKMYAQLKKRPSNDIFGDAIRLNQFMKMKFDFDKFTDEDWDNYWLLAQHCDDNRDFQKNALSIIKKYQGTDHSHYKYLYDRISMGLTGKQKYGTQNVKEQGVAENFADGKNPGRKEIDPDVYEDLSNSIIARTARQIVPTIRAKSTPEGYVYLSTQDGLSLVIGCNIAGGSIDINIGSQPMETTSSGPHKGAVTKIISAVYQAAAKQYGAPIEQGTLSIDHDAGHGVWQHIAQKLGLQYDAHMVKENFADGKHPEDKGDSKRHGINTKASVSSLRKTAKQGGRKGQLAHWMANMKAGKAKKK